MIPFGQIYMMYNEISSLHLTHLSLRSRGQCAAPTDQIPIFTSAFSEF